jgi:outer membrane protein assembly factor BamB/cytochrome c553
MHGPRSSLAGLTALLLAALLVGCSAGEDETGVGVPEAAPPEAADLADEWPVPNADYQNSRVATSAIDSTNVADLGIAWTAPITASGAFGGYASTPIVANGAVYTQDLESNVRAYDLETGERLWERIYDSPTVGPNGVTLGYGKLFGLTSEVAFALDPDSGDELWRSRTLPRNDNEGIDMAPIAYDGRFIVSTVPGNTESFYAGNGVGIVHALDVDTGDVLWSWNTVPEDLWSEEHTDINSGGGLWHPPGFSADGDMYVSVANPAPWPGTNELPWGQSRPGPNLHTNSLVKLDPETGELDWYYQALPHDVYDWDLHLPPIVAHDGDRELILTGGKMGYVYAVGTGGELVWKVPVGRHNGHDTDNQIALEGNYEAMPELPVTIWPGILGGVETQMAVADGVVYAPVVNLSTTFPTQERQELPIGSGTGEMVALDLATGAVRWKTYLPTPAYGAATVANDLVFTTTFDGTVYALARDDGRIVYAGQLPAGTNATVAIVGDTLVTAASFPQGAGQRAQIVALRLGAGETLPAPQPPEEDGGAGGGGDGQAPEGEGGGAGPGEEEGGDGAPSEETLTAGREVFTSSCGSCHVLADAGTTGQVGPSLDQTELSRAAIEQQVRNGGGGMPAFEGRLTDEQIENVSTYVAEVADPSAEPPSGGGGP